MLGDPYRLLKEAMIKESPFLCEKTKAECICYLAEKQKQNDAQEYDILFGRPIKNNKSNFEVGIC